VRHRPSLVALVAFLVATGFSAAPRMPGALALSRPDPGEVSSDGARPASATIELAGQPPWVPPDSSAVLVLGSTGPVEGTAVRITAHRAVTSRSALNRNLEGSALGAVEGRLSFPFDSLPHDPQGHRLLTVGVQGPESGTDPFRIVPGRTGVYPLELELLRGDETLDRFVTPLVVVAPGLVPLTLAWVWRFDATPARRPSGAVRGAAARAFAPGGRLARLADAAANAADVGLTLAPTPESLEAWAEGAQDGRRSATGGGFAPAESLAGLRAAVSQSTHEVLGGPYVPFDMPALLSADLGSEIDRQFDRGSGILTEVLGLPGVGSTILSGRLDAASVGRLRQYGVERVVVSPSALQPVPQRLTPGRPFLLPGKGRRVTAAVSDPDLARLLSGNGPPALLAARFLAALSLVALEAPREPRGVVVVMPAGWDPPAELLDAVLDGLRYHPAVQPETLDRFFARVGPELRDGQPVVRNLAGRSAGDPEVDPDAVRSTRRRLSAFTNVVGQGPPFLAAEEALLTSLTDPPGEEARNAFKGRSTPRAYLSAASRLMEDVTGRVRGPDGQRVTLTARRASIPISLLNANAVSLQVRVRLESDQLRFPGGSERLVNLAPQNTTEHFAVETRAPGAFPLVITVTSPDGQLVVNRSKLTIRSTVVSGVGKLLTAGAGIFLLIWWGNDLRRAHRRRHQEGGEPPRPAELVPGDTPEPGAEDVHVATPAG
jgi:hypothetical protein